MNHIEIGDYVVSLIDFNGILINGEKYLVINTNNDDIIIICSDNKIHQFSNEYFKHLTVEELNSSFEKLDKPGCLSAMKKLGKVLGLHFN